MSRIIFDIQNDAFPGFHSSVQLAISEIIVSFKGWVIFTKYISKKHKHLCLKIYNLCDKQDMYVLPRKRQNMFY